MHYIPYIIIIDNNVHDKHAWLEMRIILKPIVIHNNS